MSSLVGQDITIELDAVGRQFEPYLQIPPDAFACRRCGVMVRPAAGQIGEWTGVRPAAGRTIT